MAILNTNNNLTGNKSLVWTAYSAAYNLDRGRRFWAIAQEQATPEGWSAAANLAVRTLIDTVLSNATPLDLMTYYSLLEDANSGWSDLGISSLNDTTVGESLSAQYKTDLLTLLAGTATGFLTELQIEVESLLV